uniref:Uncharacterized protein n=1 Tax=Avena sativa TaxID=4498 RepID=A0ACD5ZWQ4_AVESA
MRSSWSGPWICCGDFNETRCRYSCKAKDPRRGVQTPVAHNFRYEAMWRRASDYTETVEAAWAASRGANVSLASTWASINRMAPMLRDWSRSTFGSVRKQIRKLEQRLFFLRGQAVTEEYVKEERVIEQKLCDLFECEDIMAHQRSRVDWLREGDRSTAFFHAKAAARKRTNKINSIIREDGSKCDSQGEIKGMVHKFYENLFSSEPYESVDAVLDAIPKKVTEEMNSDLCVRWGIGDGKSVKIMCDNWVPGFPPDAIQSTSPIPRNATVHCLMDGEARTWNQENVQAFFAPDIADQILQIPISRRADSDFACWPLTRHGMYTVKSGYNLARSAKFLHWRSSTGQGLSSGWMEGDKQWRAIWRIKALGKMKIHLWRFAHNCLPSGDQLQKRRVVWREIKCYFNFQLRRKNFSSCRQWLFDFLEQASDLHAAVLAATFWHIWDARNEARNSMEKPNPQRTCAKILAYMDLIKEHLLKCSPVTRRESNAPPKWTPPPPGVLLLNVDAAIFEAVGLMGAGMVVRDSMGIFVMACRFQMQGVVSPEHAEALALKRTIRLAHEEGYDRVLFASDCLSLVQRLHSASPDRSMVGLVVDDIKLATSSFTLASFIHVKRV